MSGVRVVACVDLFLLVIVSVQGLPVVARRTVSGARVVCRPAASRHVHTAILGPVGPSSTTKKEKTDAQGHEKTCVDIHWRGITLCREL
eukprot:2432700-Pyramimonas_sp.AAC.1